MTVAPHMCEDLRWVPPTPPLLAHVTYSTLRTGKLSTEEVHDLSKGTQLVGAGGRVPPHPTLPGQPGPRVHAPVHDLSWPSMSPSSWGRAGTGARTPLSVLLCAPAPRQGPGLLCCRKRAWQPGPRLVREAVGGQETDPKDRGLLSACRWAGRPGPCSPAGPGASRVQTH